MQKSILVTGGAGYIGSACAAALIEDGHAVAVYDNFSTGQREKVPTGATLIEGDITDAVALRAAFDAHHFDAVIHCAAKKAVGESEVEPAVYFHTNVTGTLTLLTAMANAHVPNIIFSSTAAVYGAPADNRAITESSPLGPVNVYGQSKLMAETLISEFVRTKKLAQYTILRYFNVAGDAGLRYTEEAAQNVFPLLARSYRDGRPFGIFGTDYSTPDGTCVRDYIHLRDLVTAHVQALHTTTSDTYNLGTGTGYSVRELVSAFQAAVPEPPTVVEQPRRAGDPARLTADPTKAHKGLGWQATHTLDDIVRDVAVAYQLIERK